jgi:O-antigen/teichoic acid export membrane protein
MLAALAVTAGVIALRYREPVAWIVAAVALAKACEGGSDIIYGYQQRRDRLDRVARSQIARGAVAVLAGIGVLVATDSVAAVAWATAAVYAGGLLWDAWSTPDTTAMLRSDAAAIGRLLRQYGQLGLVTAIGSLQINIRGTSSSTTSRAGSACWDDATLLMLGSLIINAMPAR